MSNVWEWSSDWYSATYYESSPSIDPPGLSTGDWGAFGGGGLFRTAGNQASSYREGDLPDFATEAGGFRVARNP